MTVQNQAVIGRDFGECLACNGKTIVGNIFPGEDIYHTRNEFGGCGVDFFYNGVRYRFRPDGMISSLKYQELYQEYLNNKEA